MVYKQDTYIGKPVDYTDIAISRFILSGKRVHMGKSENVLITEAEIRQTEVMRF